MGGIERNLWTDRISIHVEIFTGRWEIGTFGRKVKYALRSE